VRPPVPSGTAVAQQSLRSVLSFCNSPQMNAPEAYIHFTPGLITDEGEVTVDSVREFLRSYMAEFHTFIGRVLSVVPGRFDGGRCVARNRNAPIRVPLTAARSPTSGPAPGRQCRFGLLARSAHDHRFRRFSAEPAGHISSYFTGNCDCQRR
jgi:hypothetical protein